MTRRVMLALIALVMVAADEPHRPRPYDGLGTITIIERDFDGVTARAYFLKPLLPIAGHDEVPLILGAEELLEILDRAEAAHARVHVRGAWVKRAGVDFLVVRSIEEVKP